MNNSARRIANIGFTTHHTGLSQEECSDADGRGERLGLNAMVSKAQFTSLMRGYHLETGKPLQKSAGRSVKES